MGAGSQHDSDFHKVHYSVKSSTLMFKWSNSSAFCGMEHLWLAILMT
jgi:hypothetical protein